MKEIKGVDLSYVQEGIDYKKLAESGVKFAIIRLGFGCKEDVTAVGHINGCLKNGIDYGFYWYSYAVTAEIAKEEAQTCVNVLRKYAKPTYPVFWDMEEQRQIEMLNNTQRTEFAVGFCEKVKAAGYLSGIYANPSWIETYYEKDKIIGKYDIWLAHWTGNPEKKSRYVYGQKIWQWGIDNIGGYSVDGNLCFADYPSITEEFYSQFVSKEKADKAEKIFLSGDEVFLKKAPVYVSSTEKKKAGTLSGAYFIHSPNIINKRIRVTTPKGNNVVTGWVNTADCLENKANSVVIEANDLVKVHPEATLWDNGVRIPSWVREITYTVRTIANGRAVIGEYINGDFCVTGAISVKFLVLVKKDGK